MWRFREMEKGYLKLTNVTEAAAEPPIKVQTEITIKGDPGYLLTAGVSPLIPKDASHLLNQSSFIVMIAECALSLILPPYIGQGQLSTPDVRRLTPFAKKGGVLTPVTAFGEEIVRRLCMTDKFGFRSYVVEENAARESKKDI